MSFISYLFNGLSLGSVYAIIALGYTMVYGIAKMLNFAHGDVIMIGAYVSLLSMTNAGIPAFPALIISIVVCTVLLSLRELHTNHLEMHLLHLRFLLLQSVSATYFRMLHFYFLEPMHRLFHQSSNGRDFH